MTAEIAIMNKMGVALAADSAVTINGGAKIYNTANKLFTLSKYHPLGIMIYNNPECLQIPWEIIIKLFRKKINKNNKPKLIDFVNNFILFVEKEIKFDYPENEFVISKISIFADAFVNLLKINKNNIKDIQTQLEKIYQDIIQNKIDITQEVWACDYIQKKYLPNIEKIINEKFKTANLSEVTNDFISLIVNLSPYYFSRISITFSRFFKIPLTVSGIIVAGYGSDEIFPSLYHVLIDGIVNKKLIMFENVEQNITYNKSAVILPFAQSEMVETFLSGIDPEYTNIINDGVNNFMDVFVNEVLNQTQWPDINKQQEFNEKLFQIKQKYFDMLCNNIKRHKQNNHVVPIVRGVESFSKGDLATMAETLVNLTSFKRRVTLNQIENVGGPIDVAFISKGDGFTWIKRKLYFEPKYNHHFFENYFKEE